MVGSRCAGTITGASGRLLLNFVFECTGVLVVGYVEYYFAVGREKNEEQKAERFIVETTFSFKKTSLFHKLLFLSII